MNKTLCIVVSFFLLAYSTLLQAVDPKTTDNSGGPTVTFDHLAGVSQSQKVIARPGDVITIIVANTCPEAFNYEMGGVVSLTADRSSFTAADDPGCKVKEHKLFQTHTSQYDGYYLNIDSKSREDQIAAEVKGVKKILTNVRYLVIVETLEWDIAFAGGFTISDLTDPRFASGENTAGVDSIFRDKNAEDAASLGLAAMVHVYHQKNPQWAFSFGLATGDSNETAYMIGPTYRFGQKAAITLGYMWAPVERLPSGVKIGDPLEDPNSLVNLQSRTEGGAFLSISYSFFSGIQGIFEKPFKGEKTSVKSENASNNNGKNTAGDSSVDNPPATNGINNAACNSTSKDPKQDQDDDKVMADKDSDDCDPGKK